MMITNYVKIEILMSMLATHPEYSRAVPSLKFLIVVHVLSGAML